MSAADVRYIAVEEHFSTSAAQDGLAGLAAAHGRPRWFGQLPPGDVLDALYDLSQARVAAMDAAGLDVQVLSLSAPGVNDFAPKDAAAVSRDVNDVLADAVARYPQRLVGMATVALHDPASAPAELERAVTKLGLRGAIVNGHVDGAYLDDQRFWPFLEAAAALGVPLYLHPRDVPGPAASYIEVPGFAGWSMGVEENIQVAKLIAGGALDRFPDLRLVVGHLGGGITFALPRIDNRFAAVAAAGVADVLPRSPGEYLREHFYVSTSGMLYADRVRLAIDTFGADRVLLATDYPMETLSEDMATFRSLDLTPEEHRKVAGANAASLYGLDSD